MKIIVLLACLVGSTWAECGGIIIPTVPCTGDCGSTTEEPTTTECPTEEITSEATSKTRSTTTSVGTTPSAPAGIQRTVVFMRFGSQLGQYLFIKGGISTKRRPECITAVNATTSPCAIPVTVRSLGTIPHYDKYNTLRVGDNYLDFFGRESTQPTDFQGEPNYGTPLAWTTSDVSDDLGRYQPLNTYGPDYWMVDFDMDCDKTEKGWFEIIGTDNSNQEPLVNQDLYCGGSVGGVKPYDGVNHLGLCGYINVFEFTRRQCEIDSFPINSTSINF